MSADFVSVVVRLSVAITAATAALTMVSLFYWRRPHTTTTISTEVTQEGHRASSRLIPGPRPALRQEHPSVETRSMVEIASSDSLEAQLVIRVQLGLLPATQGEIVESLPATD